MRGPRARTLLHKRVVSQLCHPRNFSKIRSFRRASATLVVSVVAKTFTPGQLPKARAAPRAPCCPQNDVSEERLNRERKSERMALSEDAP